MLETYHRRTEPVGKGGRRLLHGLASSPPWTNVTMALAGLYGLGAWGLGPEIVLGLARKHWNIHTRAARNDVWGPAPAFACK